MSAAVLEMMRRNEIQTDRGWRGLARRTPSKNNARQDDRVF